MALLDRFAAIASASAAVRRGIALIEADKAAEGFIQDLQQALDDAK